MSEATVLPEESRGSDYESQHVHEVYEQIASHFSATRYKAWPIIKQFLLGLTPGSIGLDIGCGNGKYLLVNPDVYIIGSDRSPSLTSFAAKHQPHSAVVADMMALPHPIGTFDFAISIAVVHHLSTPERRIDALRAVLEPLRPGGRAIVYAWALEQKDSRRGWDEGDEQDVMVPWVMKAPQPHKKEKQQKGVRKQQNRQQQPIEPDSSEKKEEVETAEQAAPAEPAADKTFHRYYHLYRKGELEHDFEAAGGNIVESGYEKDNWWAVAERKQD